MVVSCTNSRPALTLYVDRILFDRFFTDSTGMSDPAMNLRKEIECVFDRIFFFDDFPIVESNLNMAQHSDEHLAVFLS